MFRLLGTPSEKVWPGFDKLPHAQSFGFAQHPSKLRESFPLITENGMNLLTQLLNYDPRKRIPAEDAMKHAYFSDEPKAKDPSEFPVWPSKSEKKRGCDQVDQEDSLRRQLGVFDGTSFKIKF
jgi:cell division cycle 2-like protein